MEQNTNTGELRHWGIKGMKWGVRRYQNKDGTLTPAGKRRADKMKEEYTALTGKRLIRKPTSKKNDTNKQNEVEPIKKKSIKEMSDEEIRNKINRLESEKRLASLEADTATTGKKIARSVAKDMVAPAALEAGKSLIKDLLLKVGKEKLGLNESKVEAVDEVYGELKREMDKSEFTVRKMKADKYIKDREAEAKKAKEDAKATKQAEKQAKREAKENDKLIDKYKKMYDEVDKELSQDVQRGEATVNQYNNLLLPPPDKRKD
jgi:hypothetical protein